MIPKLKLDETGSTRLESELGVSTENGRTPDAESYYGSMGRGGGFRPQVQQSLPRPQSSRLILSRLLRRYKFLIAVLVLASLGVGALGVSTLKDSYTATTLLILDQSGTRLLGPETPPPLNVDAEAELLKAESIALRVIDQLNLTADPEFMPKQGRLSKIIGSVKEALTPVLNALGLRNGRQDDAASLVQDSSGVQPLPPEKAAALQILKQKVAIRRRGLTDLLAVEATSENAQQAARIANAYAKSYLDEQVAVKAQSVDRIEQIVTRQLAELNEELKRSEANIGLRQSYQENLNRLRTLAQRRETLGPDARIVSPARPPRGPAFPDVRLLGVVGIVLSTAVGLGLALGFATWREASLRRAYTTDDVEAASGVPNLAVIPRQKPSSRGKRLRPLSEKGGEEARKLLFKLQALDNKGLKLSALLITSSRFDEDHAPLALSLGEVAGLAGSRAVVVDCDLRNPRLHSDLGLPNEKGLADLLAARGNLHDVIQIDEVSGCKIITAGDVGELADGALRPDRLKNALRKLRLEFDHIILSAPALQHSADPLLLGSMSDAALFVVRAGEATLDEIRSDIDQLRVSSEGRIFSIITNAPGRG